MLGQDYIKVYDGLVADSTIAMIPQHRGVPQPLEHLVDNDELDQQVFQAFLKAMNQYRIMFPRVTDHWTNESGDDGFIVNQPAPHVVKYATSDNRCHRAVATALLFTNDKTYVEFPHQGSVFQGRKGRIVLFPAFWTHKYRTMGEGAFISTNFVQGGPPRK